MVVSWLVIAFQVIEVTEIKLQIIASVLRRIILRQGGYLFASVLYGLSCLSVCLSVLQQDCYEVMDECFELETVDYISV